MTNDEPLSSSSSNDEAYDDQSDNEDNGIDSDSSSSSHDTNLKYENEIIHDDLLKSNQNSYKIVNLDRRFNYLVQLYALSELTSEKQLVSMPSKLKIKNIDALISKQVNEKPTVKSEARNESYLSYDDYYTDLDDEATKKVSKSEIESNIGESSIRNLTVYRPYFQNGLVKAKLSWQFMNNLPSSITTLTNGLVQSNNQFTLIWFPIKCLHVNGSLLKQTELPTPITSLTQKTQFEVYELKYNCDYVVNVRLNMNQQQQQQSQALTIQQSASLKRQQQPQIVATTQFKVPSCSEIYIIGRIKPLCYETSDDEKSSNNENINKNLPVVSDIKQNIKSLTINTYQIEFEWNLPDNFDKYDVLGYKISITQLKSDSDSPSSPSVVSIVNRDQLKYKANDLKYGLNYVFKIQLIDSKTLLLGSEKQVIFKYDVPVQDNKVTTTLTSVISSSSSVLSNKYISEQHLNEYENNVLEKKFDFILLTSTPVSPFIAPSSSSLLNSIPSASLLSHSKSKINKNRNLFNNKTSTTSSSSLLNYFYYDQISNKQNSNQNLINISNMLKFKYKYLIGYLVVKFFLIK